MLGAGGEATRRRLEEDWRHRLRDAQDRYKTAAADHRSALEQQMQTLLPSQDGEFAVQQTARAEIAAMRDYLRVLRVFTDLIVDGKLPPAE